MILPSSFFPRWISFVCLLWLAWPGIGVGLGPWCIDVNGFWWFYLCVVVMAGIQRKPGVGREPFCVERDHLRPG